ncbi:MAG: carbohydrate ABC transporter permease [Culicoidibacterales bacterium]
MKKSNLGFYGFIFPAVFSFLVIIVIPFIIGVYYSFTDWTGIPSNPVNFIGFKNFSALLSDELFYQAFQFTALFAVVSVLLLNIFGLSLALLVTRGMKKSTGHRAIFFLPNLIGGLILGFVWQFVFTNVLPVLGLPNLLATAVGGFWALVILMSWQMSGYLMVIYIAAIQNIPEDLIEAAKIDGATSRQRTRYILIPMVAPATTISLFLTLANSFKLYDQNLALTAGGPGNKTMMLAMDIVNTANAKGLWGYAQAKAIIFFLVVAAIALIQVYISKKREVEL